MVQKAVNTKTKKDLKFSTMVKDLDIYCPRSYHLSYNTFLKVQTQNFNNKYFFHSEKSKPKVSMSAPLCDNVVEPAKKKNRKNKKKRF